MVLRRPILVHKRQKLRKMVLSAERTVPKSVCNTKNIINSRVYIKIYHSIRAVWVPYPPLNPKMGPLFKNVALTLGANFFNPNGTPYLGPILVHGSRGRVAKIRDTIGRRAALDRLFSSKYYRGASWKHRILTRAAHRPPNYSLSLLFSFFFLSVLFFRFVLSIYSIAYTLHTRVRRLICLTHDRYLPLRAARSGVWHTCRRAERVPLGV